jgi:hypothetical protein
MQPDLLFSPAHDGSGAVDHVPEIERIANQLADTRLRLDAHKKIIADLLRHVGLPGICKRCAAPIFRVRHLNGELTPYSHEGTNHSISCEKRDQFRRKGDDECQIAK